MPYFQSLYSSPSSWRSFAISDTVYILSLVVEPRDDFAANRGEQFHDSAFRMVG